MEIHVFAPEDVESIKIDKSALHKDLSVSDYNSLFENDELDYFKLFETYGFQYIVNETWVKVVTNTGSSIEISSHEILSELFHSPDQFEGIEAHIIGHFLGVFSSVAGGQGGGGIVD